ncbi:MAG: hypothetical protein D6729_08235, partial [Deltaproteobacteria bacterium]
MVAVQRPDGTSTRYEDQNLLGWPRTVVEGGVTTTVAYNARGQVAQVVDPSGEETRVFYDPFGASVRIERGPASAPAFVEQVEYDDVGRPLRWTRGDGHVLQAVYDAAGDPTQLWWQTAPGGATLLIARSYDSLGRLVTATRYNPGIESALGAGIGTVTTQLGYDALGRVVQEQTAIGGGPSFSTTQSWRPSGGGWVRELQTPTGMALEEHLDALGRLVSQRRLDRQGEDIDFSWSGGTYLGRVHGWSPGADPLTETATLDSHGVPSAWRYEAVQRSAAGPQNPGWADAYCGGSYDPAACGDPLLEISLLRDAAGRVASESWRFGHPVLDGAGTRVPGVAHASRWQGYRYGPRGELATVWEGEDADVGALVQRRVLESDVEAVATAAGARRWDYVREAGEPSLREIRSGTDLRLSLGPRGVGHTISSAAVGGGVAHSLGYDGAGRLTTGIGITLQWDALDALVSVTREGDGAVERYAWDALGRLAARYEGSALAAAYGYDGWEMVAAVDGSGAPIWSARYGPGEKRLLEYEAHAEGRRYVVLTDARHNVVGAWDATLGRMASVAEYDADGRMTVRGPDETELCSEVGSEVPCGGVAGLPFGFGGGWRSEVSGLVWMGARWYAPALGEFVSVDPLLYVDTYNPYAYAAYDPVNRWDPWGTDSKSNRGAAAAGRAGLMNPCVGQELCYTVAPDHSVVAGSGGWLQHVQAASPQTPESAWRPKKVVYDYSDPVGMRPITNPGSVPPPPQFWQRRQPKLQWFREDPNSVTYIIRKPDGSFELGSHEADAVVAEVRQTGLMGIGLLTAATGAGLLALEAGPVAAATGGMFLDVGSQSFEQLAT